MEFRNVEDKPEPRTAQNQAEVRFATVMLALLPIFIFGNAFVYWGLLIVAGILVIERAYGVKG